MSSLPGGQLDPMIESRIIKLETEMEALMKANVIEDVEKLKHELDESDSTNKQESNSIKLDIREIQN